MRTYPLVLALVALAACDGNKNDADEDGIEAPADCDDNNPDIFPGALEACDGVDNNCDGQVDEGVGATFYLDADGDGDGDSTMVARFCSDDDVYNDGTDSYSTLNTDCDDGDPTVFAAAIEDCTAVDRNCDGNPYGGATDTRDWFLDGDGDGFGTPDVSVNDCAGPIGYVDNSDDCDDFNTLVNPDADELCNGIDEDCDGTPDDNPVDAVLAYDDADDDGYGDPNTEGMYCLNLGYVTDGNDCDDTNNLINPGARDVCDGGVDNDCDPTTDEAEEDGTFVYPDADGDLFGDENAGLWVCDPTGYLADGGDCDDTDNTINPDADELCDAADRDCDGDPVDGAADATVYYADGDGDGLGADFDNVASCDGAPKGYPLTVGGDCDDADPYVTDFFWFVDADGDGVGDGTVPQVEACIQPAYTSDIAGDCDDTAAVTYPGAPELCDGGVDNDCDPTTDELLTARWYEDADYDGFGDDGQVYIGCDPLTSGLINPTQVGGDCDDADPLLNPNLTPVCTKEHCGTIAGDEIWKSGVIHYVTCDVDVQGTDKPNLLIEDGATVFFSANAGLFIGDDDAGSITVDGTDAEGVLFTSDAKVPQEGDYDGLTIGPSAEDSWISGLTVEWAGSGTGGAGLVIDSIADITVVDSLFQRNSGDGIRVEGGFPLIYDSTMVNNENNGLYVEEDQGLSRLAWDGTDGPSFTGNYINQNGARPVSIPGSHADELDPLTSILDDTTSGLGNVIPEIELLSGTMRSTGNWYAHQSTTGTLLPYFASAGTTIDVEDGPQAQLTIDDGVEVYWDLDAELTVGDGAEGRLVIGDPTTGAPSNVLFTATDNLIVNGLNWDGVTLGEFDNTNNPTYINGLTIEYGGANGKGNIEIDDSAPTIENTITRFSDTSGIYVTGTDAAPRIQDSQLVDNDEDGLYVANTSGIARDVAGPTFTGNVCNGNGFAPVRMPPNFLGELDDTTTFSGNGERILVWGGDVLEDAVWQALDEDYHFFGGDVDIEGPQDPVVQIEPAVTIYMARDIAFEIGNDDDGSLLIDADPGERVIFTSADAAPGPGDWEGLTIGDNGPLFSQTDVRGLEIWYAGTNINGGAVHLANKGCPGPSPRTVIMEDVHIILSSTYAFYFENNVTSLDLTDATFDTPFDGFLFAYQIPTPTCPAGELLTNVNPTYTNVLYVGSIEVSSIAAFDTADVLPGSIFIQSDEIETDTFFPDFTIDGASIYPYDYVFEDEVEIAGVANPTMEIEAGATLAFDSSAGIQVATTSEPGALVVNPGATLTDRTGSWLGIDIKSNGFVDIDGATIDDGGNQGDAQIINTDGAGTVSNTTFTNSVTGCDVFDDNWVAPVPTCDAGESCLTVVNNAATYCAP